MAKTLPPLTPRLRVPVHVVAQQTSGGTVLSTNWDEVAKKDYEQERQAPEGMEWRKWG